MKNNTSKRKTRNDLILAALIIVISAVCLLFFNSTKKNGNGISVKVDSSCCAGVTPESHENALNAMKMCQIEVI